MRYGYNNTGQGLFDYTFSAILFILGCGLKMLTNSSFIFTAYFITSHILHRKDNGVLWLTLVAIFSWIIKLLFNLLKEGMLRLMTKKIFWWIPIFIFCTAYTCGLPMYIIFEPVEKITSKLTSLSDTTLLTWIIMLAFGYYVFSSLKLLGDKFS